MPETAHFPPEDLVHDLAMSLWRSRRALRDLARRKAWEPTIDDCRRIAERQVEQLKRHGVEPCWAAQAVAGVIKNLADENNDAAT
jgi:hypothetical protein